MSLEAALRLGEGRPRYTLKWPNDVLAGGKKLVGIGLEAEAVGERLAIVVGIGTNVVAAPEGTPTPAGVARRARRPDQRGGAVLGTL
ncbi:biotin-(acetyl-CoA carboxylase) ligase [Bradyrhizobium sp. LM3.2]